MHSVGPFSFHLSVLPLKVSPSSSSIFYQLECQGATIISRQQWYRHSIAIHAHSFLVSNAMWQSVRPNHFEEPIHEPRLWFATRWQKLVPIFQSPKERWLSTEMVHWFCSIFYSLFILTISLLCKLGDARTLNFLHFASHLEKEWDSKDLGSQLRYFHGGNKKPNPMLVVLSPNSLSMLLLHFAIKEEKFHDLDFLSLNGFLKWCKI